MYSARSLACALLVSCIVTCVLMRHAAGLRCFVCLPNVSTGQDCRQIKDAQPSNCSDDSKHCVAVVLGNAKGDITVYRGCGGHVQDFNLGINECAMLDTWSDDLPAAYYKCKTDACNNIEPITSEVTEVVKLPAQPVAANTPK
ncbi:uncharacterized protein LOC129598278 [Paramacrobiotus metropolitanus]|uniref:uncharacterized protein LOC129598278 n=1 Tax=Paramacrobiotus metropolitanus TaxID=2943436 RepID=UPI002445E2B1|nr:uncharacterized protein LOC129598278 [Paramacrobiotus metropolitanus]